MTTSDSFVDANKAYAAHFDRGDLPATPGSRAAVVTCMDSRIDVYRALGLEEGQAHVIRNAGGIVSEDVIRSLTISQRKLGTTEIVLIHHTDCGMCSFNDDEFRKQLERETGVRPPFAMETFADPADDVRQSMRRIQASPFIANKDAIRGFVYDVKTGRLNEV